MPESALLSTEELAEFLGISAGTLYNWKYQGKGPKAVKVGALTRYRTRDVEDWLNHSQTAIDH
ncbi:helix-turn-helix domain-containing protein [Streptomyces sp. R302]|uniref:helix-turn-helix transcriptional regulator n=1 Tax=unclassified Streptomyces TaxID=2593676 RepID=UPI00145E43BD|nr:MULTISPECIES: helix-turn-helix domain-containing protein [unclassified Streptomyces]NML50777.1 helix-turn-helix domain-containing protein [Streptomyces sp. R301]NML80872.1 helix-turn-helix domain-containing protein [Streptomyces sp. R302]